MTAYRAALVTAALLGLVATAPGAHAQSNERGELIAYSCSGCHGQDFRGAGGMPLLRGRDAEELNTLMTEFRSGQRYSTVMRRLSLGLNEADIRAVSQFLSALR